MTDAANLWAGGALGKTSEKPRLIFGQVHEDAAIEVEALTFAPAGQSAFCIGSAGDTAFALLTRQPSKLLIADINPAQIYLLELKRAVFGHLSYDELLQCVLSDASPAYRRLRPHLGEDARGFWDANLNLLSTGLNAIGLIERKLRRAIRLVLPLLQSRQTVRLLFRRQKLEHQQEIYRTRWDNARWRLALRLATSKPILSLVYGRPFLEAVPHDFAALMKRRLDDVFLRFPAADNGYLWQTFFGRYPPAPENLPLYLRRENYSTIRHGLQSTQIETRDAASTLAAQPPASIGLFALSNILEVAGPNDVERLEDAVLHAAQPGAVVCLRWIFPPLPKVFRRLKLDVELSAKLAAQDRSLVCRCNQIYRCS